MIGNIREAEIAVPLDACLALVVNGQVGTAFARKMNLNRQVTARRLGDDALGKADAVDTLQVGQVFTEASSVAKNGVLGMTVPWATATQTSSLKRVSATRAEGHDALHTQGGPSATRTYVLERTAAERTRVCLQPWVMDAHQGILSGVLYGVMGAQMDKGDAFFSVILAETYAKTRK